MKDNVGGRPKKFESPEQLQLEIDKYFKTMDKEQRPYTISGLALFLDTTRETLLDYENKYENYSDTVKKAKLKILNFNEESLYTNRNVTGVIFNLKCNFGFQDSQNINISSSKEKKNLFDYFKEDNK